MKMMSWRSNGRLRKWKKVEEKLQQKKFGGDVLQYEALQKVPGLVASQPIFEGKKWEGKGGGRKVVGWSIEELDQKVSGLLVKDTEDMVGWRIMSLEEVDQCWMRIAGKIEEEVLDKYKVVDSKREVYRGRGAPPEWRLVRRSQKYRLRKWSEDCWARIFSWIREYNLQRKRSMQEGSTEEEEMNQQQRMKAMKDMTRKTKAKGRMDASNSWWVSELLAAMV